MYNGGRGGRGRRPDAGGAPRRRSEAQRSEPPHACGRVAAVAPFTAANSATRAHPGAVRAASRSYGSLAALNGKFSQSIHGTASGRAVGALVLAWAAAVTVTWRVSAAG